MAHQIIFWILCGTLIGSCAKKIVYPVLGDKVVGPSALAMSEDGKYFYVLNSDPERIYNQGSLMVISADGDKVNTVSARRLGRSLQVAGKYLFASFESDDGGDKRPIFLYDIEDRAKPRLVWEEEIACSAFSIAARKDYKYFALSCRDGDLYIGEIPEGDAQNTKLKKVRSYGKFRRAMYLHKDENLLLMFPTDLRGQIEDQIYEDKKTVDKDFKTTDGPDEMPDYFAESKQFYRIRRGLQQNYQMVVYDIEAQSAAGFQHETIDEFLGKNHEQAKKELRWLHFEHNQSDGWSDEKLSADKKTTHKFYRTNFWAARPDPKGDERSFYLSQRGNNKEKGSNAVLRVRIKGNLKEPGKLADALSFERVYGLRGEVDNRTYPSDFALNQVEGEDLLLVNHFRELTQRRDEYSAVHMKTLSDSSEAKNTAVEFQTTQASKAYYQVELNDQGRGASLSFYGNKVILFQAQPGEELKEFKEID